jgi:hypothetical protein
LDLSLFLEVVQRGCSAKGKGGCFLVGQVGRLQGHGPIFRHGPVLGMAPKAGAGMRKDRITDVELSNVFADGFDVSSQL